MEERPDCAGTLKAHYISPPDRPVHSDTNSTSSGSILAAKAAITRDDYSFTFPPPSIAKYSFIQRSELGCHGEKKCPNVEAVAKGIRTRALAVRQDIIRLPSVL